MLVTIFKCVAIQVGDATRDRTVVGQKLRRLILIADLLVGLQNRGQHVGIVETLAGAGQVGALDASLAREAMAFEALGHCGQLATVFEIRRCSNLGQLRLQRG